MSPLQTGMSRVAPWLYGVHFSLPCIIIIRFWQPPDQTKPQTRPVTQEAQEVVMPPSHLNINLPKILTLLTYLLTYLLHGARYQDISKADCHSACQKYSAFLWNPKVHFRVRKSPHWTLSWASWIQCAPFIPISLRSISVLSSHLRLGLPSGLFPSGLPTKTL